MAGNTFTRSLGTKLAGVPVWVWVLGGGAAVGIWLLVRRGGSAPAPSATDLAPLGPLDTSQLPQGGGGGSVVLPAPVGGTGSEVTGQVPAWEADLRELIAGLPSGISQSVSAAEAAAADNLRALFAGLTGQLEQRLAPVSASVPVPSAGPAPSGPVDLPAPRSSPAQIVSSPTGFAGQQPVRDTGSTVAGHPVVEAVNDFGQAFTGVKVGNTIVNPNTPIGRQLLGLA